MSEDYLRLAFVMFSNFPESSSSSELIFTVNKNTGRENNFGKSLLWSPYLLDFAWRIEDIFDIVLKIFTNTPPCVFLGLPELWTPGGLFSRPPLLAWICPGICQRFKISWIKRKSQDLIFISQTPFSLQPLLAWICSGI